MERSERARQLAPPPLGWLAGDSFPSGRVDRARRAAADQRRFLQPGKLKPAPHRQRWHLKLEGRVQGVGYRAASLRRASDLGLSGWVRNRPDGSVELEAEGSLRALGELRLWCEKGPSAARVSSVSIREIPATGSDWFEIRT